MRDKENKAQFTLTLTPSRVKKARKEINKMNKDGEGKIKTLSNLTDEFLKTIKHEQKKTDN